MFYDIYYFNDYLLFSIQKNFSHSSAQPFKNPIGTIFCPFTETQ